MALADIGGAAVAGVTALFTIVEKPAAPNPTGEREEDIFDALIRKAATLRQERDRWRWDYEQLRDQQNAEGSGDGAGERIKIPGVETAPGRRPDWMGTAGATPIKNFNMDLSACRPWTIKGSHRVAASPVASQEPTMGDVAWTERVRSRDRATGAVEGEVVEHEPGWVAAAVDRVARMTEEINEARPVMTFCVWGETDGSPDSLGRMAEDIVAFTDKVDGYGWATYSQAFRPEPDRTRRADAPLNPRYAARKNGEAAYAAGLPRWSMPVAGGVESNDLASAWLAGWDAAFAKDKTTPSSAKPASPEPASDGADPWDALARTVAEADQNQAAECARIDAAVEAVAERERVEWTYPPTNPERGGAE